MPRNRDYDDDDYDDDYDDEPVRRPRKKQRKFKKKPQGIPPGVIIGGAVVAAVVALGIVALVVVKLGDRSKANGDVMAGPIVRNQPQPAPGTTTTTTNTPTTPAPVPVTIEFNLSNLRRGKSQFHRDTLTVDFEYVGSSQKFLSQLYSIAVKTRDGQVSRVNLGSRLGQRDSMSIENIFGGSFGGAFAGKLEVWFEYGAGGSIGGKRVSEVLTLN